ncbi:MAG: hypothetical protein R3325_16350 [Thermoanaerobaculia bacterium]|nr:hypothetical protein [Thermoanaerobaculia bacterium]
MGEEIASVLVLAGTLYLAAGAVFAVLFVLFGAARVDPQARGGSWGFRLAVLPGVAALWPLLARRWAQGEGPPEERNPHRDRARRAAG